MLEPKEYFSERIAYIVWFGVGAIISIVIFLISKPFDIMNFYSGIIGLGLLAVVGILAVYLAGRREQYGQKRNLIFISGLAFGVLVAAQVLSQGL